MLRIIIFLSLNIKKHSKNKKNRHFHELNNLINLTYNNKLKKESRKYRIQCHDVTF